MGTVAMNQRHCARKINNRTRAAICGRPRLGRIREEGMLFGGKAPLPPEASSYLMRRGLKSAKKIKIIRLLGTAEAVPFQDCQLDVEVLHVERIVFDEFAARFDVFAHERCENAFGFGQILELHLEQGAAFGIHSGFPELLRTHLTQPFVALDGVVLAALVQHVVEQVSHCLLLNRLSLNLALGSLGTLLLRLFLIGALGIAQLFLAVAARLLFHRLDVVRRLHVLLDLFVLRHHLAVLRRGRQFPVDDVRSTLRVDEDALPQAVLFFEALLDRLETLLFGNGLEPFLQLQDLFRRMTLVALEVHAFGEIEAWEQLGNDFVADALVHLVHEADVFIQRGHELGEGSAVERSSAFSVANYEAIGRTLHHDLHELAVVLDVLLELALLDAIKRRLGDEHVAALDELLHVTEEERKQQGADVRAVHVGVGHEDNFAVAQLRNIEIVFADAGAERRDHGADFLVAEHLVVARFFDVQDLSLERKNCLEPAVSALLGGAACALALDEVHFAAVGLALGAIGQFARQSAAVERALAASQVAGLAGGLARARCLDGLVDDLAGHGRILVEVRAESLVHECLYGSSDVGVELAFGLSLELRLRQFHTDYGYEPFADIIASQVFLHVLEETKLLAGVVDGSGQRCAEARYVTATIDSVDVVGEAEDGLGVAVVILQRDFHVDAVALGLHVDRLVMQHRLAAVQVLDELGDTAVELELGTLGLAGLGIGGALVGERDQQTLVEEGQLAQALRQGVVVVFGGSEDRGVRNEMDFGAALLGVTRLLQLAGGLALGVGLLPHRAVAPNLEFQ